ncbi:hypothetical protein [Cerasicoccus arenae]|uniref:Uncharacterized protein n=1 Tax=Cerasicoccus arenae TaxID=424488 RepID=A0A8J3DKD4_9BACT|nr:hypothetical protein [Cerasicoccus arenae]MBK1856861.1 hypothetical protein [Cerasicoccus arenae]GHC11347.1 hypothetical protein GCM10007047_30850 [Cerasicoccus arenae]
MTHYTQNIKICRFTAFTFGLLTLVVAAGGSFGVVWLRQGVAKSAQETQAIHTEITQAERQAAALEARIAKAHSPQYLTSRAPTNLRPTNPDQIVWMPRAQPLVPADYQDPTLPASTPAVIAVADTARTVKPTIEFPATAAAAPAASAEESPLSISFDLALSTVNESASRTRSQ